MLADILNQQAAKGEQILRDAIAPLKATGDTSASITSEVTEEGFTISARPFFSQIETGRGPRKSTQKGEFYDRMLDYVKARGMGTNEKDQKRLARFLTWKINKEGDKTFKHGGRVVYSDKLDAFVIETEKLVTQEVLKTFADEVISVFK